MGKEGYVAEDSHPAQEILVVLSYWKYIPDTDRKSPRRCIFEEMICISAMGLRVKREQVFQIVKHLGTKLGDSCMNPFKGNFTFQETYL